MLKGNVDGLEDFELLAIAGRASVHLELGRAVLGKVLGLDVWAVALS